MRKEQQAKQHKITIQKAQLHALRTTMASVMDTVNNSLNNLLILKFKMEDSNYFDEGDIKLYESIIDESHSRLNAMGNLEEFKTKEKSRGHMLDIDD